MMFTSVHHRRIVHGRHTLKNNLNNVLHSLDALSPDELETVRAKATMRLKTSTPTTSAHARTGSNTDLVLDAIVEVLSAMGVEYVNASILRKSASFKSFNEKMPELFLYLEKITTQRVERRAMLRLVIELLYQDLARMNVATTARTLMSHAHRIPAVINNNFPGYADAGLLHWIVKRGASQEAKVGARVLPR